MQCGGGMLSNGQGRGNDGFCTDVATLRRALADDMDGKGYIVDLIFFVLSVVTVAQADTHDDE
jgi:hypothetical protein